MPRPPLFLVPVVLAVLLAVAHRPPPAAAQPAPPVATPQVNLAGVAPLPLTGARRLEFEAYIGDSMRRFGVLGASVAVVQGGQVVYLQGFGVKEQGGTAPVTPDTLLAIGSTTKAMTTMMAATVVDDGGMSWDTRVVDLLPAFAVADPALTPRVTMADTFCNCTGLPTRTWQLMLPADILTPERIIASAADMPLTTPFREEFQYSNQMFVVGGYAATVAAGGAPTDLADAFRRAMGDRILGPIGMTHSTFAIDDVLANGDYAYPHGADLDGQTRPLPLLVDAGWLTEVAPAGGLWSSARDMARYVQTQLADGVAPDGTPVVSTTNLARTRAAGVTLPPVGSTILEEASQHYALGWEVGAYKGQPLVSHSGGTFGFASEVGFLPQADLGVVIINNTGGTGGGFFNFDVQFRLFELLFGQPAEFQAVADQFREAYAGGLAALRAQAGPVDAAALAPYEGRYTNPAMGEIVLALRDGRLVFQAAAIRAELRAQLDEAGHAVAYVFADPPLAGPALAATLRLGADGRPEVVLTAHGEVPDAADAGDAPETSYVFTRVGGSVPATPPR
jgi:CubicO group peptidase (beta-lactamase class C family)